MNISLDTMFIHELFQDTRIGSCNLTTFKPRQARIIHILRNGQGQTALAEAQTLHNFRILITFYKFIFTHNPQIGYTIGHGLRNIIIAEEKHLHWKIRRLNQ